MSGPDGQTTREVTAPEIPSALTNPDAYPFEVARVELRETHISWVFLAGDRVYKVKKPVRLSFLDYSTLERRLFFCEEEVRLNARLAPGIYRRVVAVSRMPSGRLRLDGAGRVEDYAVEMERLPEHRMMDRLLAAGELERAARAARSSARRLPPPGCDRAGGGRAW
ncbi:MAG: hypothetical protein IPK07_30955 [Deltaproteobacteria bacterium]|nr:hypothetical protein [Deltaproteobacteria bacterium]